MTDRNSPHAAPGAFGIIRKAVFEDPDLPPNVRLVYAVLTLHATADSRTCFPGYDEIARLSGLSRRSVATALADGARAGLWSWTRSRAANRYVVHDHEDDANRFGLPQSGEGRVQEVHSAECTCCTSQSAPVAHEQDHVTGPPNRTIESPPLSSPSAPRSAPSVCDRGAFAKSPNEVRRPAATRTRGNTYTRGGVTLALPDDFTPATYGHKGSSQQLLIRRAGGILNERGTFLTNPVRQRVKTDTGVCIVRHRDHGGNDQDCADELADIVLDAICDWLEQLPETG